MDTLQSKFLSSSITDIQSTIRAIDTKVTAMLVLLFIPMTKLNSIYAICKFLFTYKTCIWYHVGILFIILLFCVSWILAFFASINSILAINNPAERITGNKPQGKYYNGNLFKVNICDVFFNKKTPRISLDRHLASLPKDSADVHKELLFEQMKLCYIRDVKMKRSTVAYYLIEYWAILGGIIWILWLYLR